MRKVAEVPLLLYRKKSLKRREGLSFLKDKVLTEQEL